MKGEKCYFTFVCNKSEKVWIQWSLVHKIRTFSPQRPWIPWSLIKRIKFAHKSIHPFLRSWMDKSMSKDGGRQTHRQTDDRVIPIYPPPQLPLRGYKFCLDAIVSKTLLISKFIYQIVPWFTCTCLKALWKYGFAFNWPESPSILFIWIKLFDK